MGGRLERSDRTPSDMDHVLPQRGASYRRMSAQRIVNGDVTGVIGRSCAIAGAWGAQIEGRWGGSGCLLLTPAACEKSSTT
jgi:hypothetical protein